MKQIKEKIIRNEQVKSDFYKMRIESPYLAKNTKPGQFFEIRCSEELYPLLRRPLGAHRILNNGIEFLYEVVGKGTELLAQRKSGEYLDIIGPLGNGFDIARTTNNEQRTTVLIAGGIGVALLVALAEKLARKQSKLKAQSKKIYVLIGACKNSHILCEGDFKKLGAKVFIATEDGSKGHKGLVTDLLKNIRTTNTEQRTTIYACGPNAMLKTVANMAKVRRIPCQVSLEERMACGIGVCLGCPVKVRTKYEVRSTKYEYKMVCKDGPIFNAEDIVW